MDDEPTALVSLGSSMGTAQGLHTGGAQARGAEGRRSSQQTRFCRLPLLPPLRGLQAARPAPQFGGGTSPRPTWDLVKRPAVSAGIWRRVDLDSLPFPVTWAPFSSFTPGVTAKAPKGPRHNSSACPQGTKRRAPAGTKAEKRTWPHRWLTSRGMQGPRAGRDPQTSAHPTGRYSTCPQGNQPGGNGVPDWAWCGVRRSL